MPRLVSPAIAPASIAIDDQPTLMIGRDERLRPWLAGDAHALIAAFADPDIQRWHLLRLDSLTEAQEWIAETWAGWQAETVATWALTTSSGPALGRISLYFRDLPNGLGEVSYWVAPEARGAGSAPRMVTAVCDWALGDLGMHRVELAHSIDNPASCRVADKAGFEAEGTRRAALLHRDGWHDMHLHSRIGAL